MVAKTQGLPPPEFGVALHAGKVIYGNVGTRKRLDFTATGPTVGLAARIDGLTRQLERPLLATQVFADLCTTKGIGLPAQTVGGFETAVKIVGYDV